ncbi:MAG: efflux RND transporter periplasmic adaptor subunit [Cytophagales bacterium]|nr:efflux RND transporter periplasmic adaptor subunit [Cytophagales bacterium]
MRYLLIVMPVILLASCRKNDRTLAGSTGGHTHEAHSNEVPAISYTVWTDKTEMFAEFPLLVAGQESRFAAHFTQMKKHRPVVTGKLTVRLTKGNAETGVWHTVDAPGSPGIFFPELTPRLPGKYRLVFDLVTPGYTDRIVVPEVTVYSDQHAATHALPGGDREGDIRFLKEQAWKIDFQTEPAKKGVVYQTIAASGIWKHSPQSAEELVASAGGVVHFLTPLTDGLKVKKGQLLMAVSSRGLTENNWQTSLAKAKARYEQTLSAYSRKRELYQLEVVSLSEWEKTKKEYQLAKAEYEKIQANLSTEGKQIRAPFNGYVKNVRVHNGSYVEEGMTLADVGTHQGRMLEARVSPRYANVLSNIHNVFFRRPNGEWSDMRSCAGVVLSVGRKVSADQPLLPVYVLINEKREIAEGTPVEVELAVGNARESLLVPETALLENYGKYSVIVQVAGESFEQRFVRLGRRNGKKAEILKGLEAGEMVVTSGAFQVKMASMSGQTPAHGHVH